MAEVLVMRVETLKVGKGTVTLATGVLLVVAVETVKVGRGTVAL